MPVHENFINVLKGSIEMVLTRGFDFITPDARNFYMQILEPTFDPIKFLSMHTLKTSSYVNMKIKSCETVSPYFSKFLTELDSSYYTTSRQENLPYNYTFLSDIFFNKTSNEYCLIYFGNFDEQQPKGNPTHDVNNFCTIVYEDQIVNAVIITPTPLTTKAADTLNTQKQMKKRMTHFTHNEIIFNPTAHVYSAQIRILSTDEQENFFKENPYVKKSTLPISYTIDPCIKYIGAVHDDIIVCISHTMIPEMLVPYEVTHRVVKQYHDKK